MAGKSAKTKPAKPAELTPRQLAFAAAYAKHGVAERAAIEAGYTPRSARGNATRLIANDGILAEVARLLGKATAKAEVTVERIVSELALIAFADLADFVEWGFDKDNPDQPQVRLKPSHLLDKTKRRAIVEISEGQHGIKIKLAGKIEALDRLGKHQGMFKDGQADEQPPMPTQVIVQVVDASVPRADT